MMGGIFNEHRIPFEEFRNDLNSVLFVVVQIFEWKT
jgi:hypothetical protein